MSCNPAVGGVGKGQLVRELDALGGEIARLTDRAGIHFRQLNASKGKAVRSSRAQVDRQLYRRLMKQALEQTLTDEVRSQKSEARSQKCSDPDTLTGKRSGRPESGVRLYQAAVARVLTRGKTCIGVETELGEKLYAKTIVLAPGTFLNGLVHIGMTSFPAGRLGEAPAQALSRSLRKMGFRLGRFKTGTPPRIDLRSVDTDRMMKQGGDEPPVAFSDWTDEPPRNLVNCYIAYTNPATHRIVRAGLKQSPLYAGLIKGRGVRYCPSIEDKVVKFAGRERHHIFIEPEGADTVECYPNGISTSLPVKLQLKLLHSIEGLEECRMLRPGYAIEHDYSDPTQLHATMETRLFQNLYFAGQVNGTTGYEEAAAQGFVAGVNAALRVKEKPEFTLTRADSYIGVMIDDLVTRGTDEPYRMFTARVEYRLLLREDNADLRLGARGHDLGLLSDDQFARIQKKVSSVADAHAWLAKARVRPTAAVNRKLKALGTSPISESVAPLELLRRPEVTWPDLAAMAESVPDLPVRVQDLVELEVKYEGYVARLNKQMAEFDELESMRIPARLDFKRVAGLSNEALERLARSRPTSVGQAQRIPGITPAAVFALIVHLRRH
jgi:tRNA uridine 5-carboxymethylaminomethyl modification enzyme